MSDNNPRPIAKFFADILQIVLSLVVISVVVSMARAKQSGEAAPNPVKAGVKATHQILIDAKEGWYSIGEEKDTIK
jgi:hypothetical protein